MTYLITYTTPRSPVPRHSLWVCRAPMDTAGALESFKTLNRSATVLSIAECTGQEVEA